MFGNFRQIALMGLVLAGLGSGRGQASEPLSYFPTSSPNLQAPFFGSAQAAFGAPIQTRRMSLTLSSLAIARNQGASFRVQDFENYRLGYQKDLPCAEGASCDITLGVDYQGDGFLDDFIDGYHDLIGAPEGDRPSLPSNEHRFQVLGQGVTIAGRGKEGLTLAPVLVRMVRPSGQGEVVASLTLPLLPKSMAVTGHSPGFSLGYQWRGLHPRLSLVGLGIGGGVPYKGSVAPRLNWHAQLSLAPPTLLGRRQLLTILVQSRPVKGYKADQFNDIGSLLIYEIELKPGGKSRFKLVEDLENGQDFTLGLTW